MVEGLGFRVGADLADHQLHTRPCVLGLEFRVRVLGTGFWVLGFGFRVSGFGFQDQGEGRVQHLKSRAQDSGPGV
jgi:hypothetical protein